MAKLTQKDKVVRGAKFEGEVAASLRFAGAWTLKIIAGYSGTPFDHIAVMPSQDAIAVECKTVHERRTLPYSRLKNTQGEWKEAEELDKFMQYGDSYILCNYRTKKTNECYVIPWEIVRDDFWSDINAGKNGSINLEVFPQSKRIKISDKRYGWDLKCLSKRNVMEMGHTK